MSKTVLKRIIPIFLVLVIVTSVLLFLLRTSDVEPDNPEGGMPKTEAPQTDEPQIDEPQINELYANETPSIEAAEKDAFDIVDSMRVGWNLGNTLDSIDNRGRGIRGGLQEGVTPEEHYETYWGNPITTREMIDAAAEAGFGAIRIPVTYTDHMDENFQIRPEWLLRVEQIVSYVLDTGAYCIINIHHDTGSGSWPWLRADPDNIDELCERFGAVWIQIAEHFRDYDDKLVFESFNEILDTQSRWGGASNEAYLAVNKFNQVFVDTVRATGGNNAKRFLIVKTYASGVDEDILEAFVLPADSMERRLIVSVHTYAPHAFTWTQDKASWTQTHPDWEQVRDGALVEDIISRLSTTFVQRGIPVIVGEFGAMNKNNTVDRVNYARHFIETAKKYGITCFWWDDGGIFENADLVSGFALLDRYRVQWFFPEIAETLVETAVP